MADAGFFKGTSAEQDSRFANKQKKLLKQMKFPDNIDTKIDMSKVNLDVIKSWITTRLAELLGLEDDVVIEFVFNQLEDKSPDPKMMQINLTGFLGGSKARLFIGELWNLLASGQSLPDGIPAELVEMKKKYLQKKKEEDDRLRDVRKREEDSYRHDTKGDSDKLNGRNQVSSSNSRSRHENGNNPGYKSRSNYDEDRRDRRRPDDRYDRRRSPPPRGRRSPSPPSKKHRSPSPPPKGRRPPSPPSKKRRSPSPPPKSRRSSSPSPKKRRSPSPPPKTRRSPSPPSSKKRRS
ncbi:unnamed protein product, partial [Rotaria sp. Silwood2]